MKQFKGSITKQIGKPIWQKSFYDHGIRNQQDYDEIWQYIENNPLKYTLKKAPGKRRLFVGERSSPLRYCMIDFVGATCGRPLKQCGYPARGRTQFAPTAMYDRIRRGDLRSPIRTGLLSNKLSHTTHLPKHRTQ